MATKKPAPKKAVKAVAKPAKKVAAAKKATKPAPKKAAKPTAKKVVPAKKAAKYYRGEVSYAILEKTGNLKKIGPLM